MNRNGVRLKSEPCPTEIGISVRQPPEYAPINYLVNSVPYSSESNGLAGRLTNDVLGTGTCLPHSLGSASVFNGCNFDALADLAQAKHAGLRPPKGFSDPELRGFNLRTGLGLSVLFSPWTDFCLLCWADYQRRYDQGEVDDKPTERPTLILAKDYYPLSCCSITAGNDWGVEEIMVLNNICSVYWKKKFCCSLIPPQDKSTQNLFNAIGKAATPGQSLEDFIGQKRIFIYNIWPWFRCGQSPSGNGGIHSDFTHVRIRIIWDWLDQLIACLNPGKVAALGDWSYRDPSLTYPTPDAFLRKYSKALGPTITVDVFRHPSASRKPHDWLSPWAPDPWIRPRWVGKTNAEAFRDFVK
jgi:hypothetical protein